MCAENLSLPSAAPTRFYVTCGIMDFVLIVSLYVCSNISMHSAAVLSMASNRTSYNSD